jgi:hypothetical protein
MSNEVHDRVNPNLLLEFFLTFSRAEFALKNSGFVRGNERKVSPNWDSFAASIKHTFTKHKSDELREAANFILDNPPMQQVLRQNTLMWETKVSDENLMEIEVLIRLVRLIRNNLFHGAKHNVTPFENTDRTSRLLKSSLIVLQECLLLAPHVKTTYDEATM